jgi:hypothetical protein
MTCLTGVLGFTLQPGCTFRRERIERCSSGHHTALDSPPVQKALGNSLRVGFIVFCDQAYDVRLDIKVHPPGKLRSECSHRTFIACCPCVIRALEHADVFWSREGGTCVLLGSAMTPKSVEDTSQAAHLCILEKWGVVVWSHYGRRILSPSGQESGSQSVKLSADLLASSMWGVSRQRQ